jgi:hypothetical protein
VGLAVVYLIRGVFCFDLEGVELVVGGGRGEGEAVFVADQLGDFGVGAIEFGRVVGEIDAAAGGSGKLLQGLICLTKALVD